MFNMVGLWYADTTEKAVSDLFFLGRVRNQRDDDACVFFKGGEPGA